MSGNELGTKGKATRGKAKVDGLERSELRPRLLVPTPAQLERGERIIDADPEIWPKAVKDMVRRCDRAGWTARVTYSHFMAVPPVSGADVGQWVETHSLAVRMYREWDGRAWGIWLGTQRLGWNFDCAAFWGNFMGSPRAVNATELNGLVTGTMTMKVNERTGGYRVEEVAQSAVVRA